MKIPLRLALLLDAVALLDTALLLGVVLLLEGVGVPPPELELWAALLLGVVLLDTVELALESEEQFMLAATE